MFITKIEVEGFKNIQKIQMNCKNDLNILCGENAQGKTNFVEAIWLCTGCKSFRGSKEKDFIGFDKEEAKISINFVDNQRSQTIKLLFKKDKKEIFLNGVKVLRQASLFEAFRCVTFTPDDLEISKGAPENRRNFLDISISQLKPSYISVLNSYNKILAQRNALLKSLQFDEGDINILDILDEQMAKTGAIITILRSIYVDDLNQFSQKMYSYISQKKEKLELTYYSSIYKGKLESFTKEEIEIFYITKLKNTRFEDIKSGFTQTGIHRDDLITKINDLNAREYGSQGQQRSVALVMKLSQAELIHAKSGDKPVVILDDVLSELDLPRQTYIIREISHMQIFITCCDALTVMVAKVGEIFYIEKGKIIHDID